MKSDTKLVLKVLYILAWIIFVGISIEAGGFITNAVFALLKPTVVKNLYHQVDLSELFRYDSGHFFVQTLLSSIVLVLKATLFYQIIRMLHDKKLNMSQPFNKEMRRFILGLAFISLLVGLFSFYGAKYAEWLASNGVKMPDAQQLRLGGADVWLFMTVIFFVIAQIFKRGIEIQTENELTV